MSPDKRTLQALAALENDSSFKTVMDWITALRDEARANDRTLLDTHVRWNQGRAQFGTEIIDAAKSARTELQKMK